MIKYFFFPFFFSPADWLYSLYHIDFLYSCTASSALQPLRPHCLQGHLWNSLQVCVSSQLELGMNRVQHDPAHCLHTAKKLGCFFNVTVRGCGYKCIPLLGLCDKKGFFLYKHSLRCLKFYWPCRKIDSVKLWFQILQKSYLHQKCYYKHFEKSWK